MVNVQGMKMLSEFIGTFILTAAINFTTSYDSGSQAGYLFAILGGFFVAITLTREISGGHINPGVTMTVYFSERDEREKAEFANHIWVYFIGQIGGALSASLLCFVIYDENIFKLAIHPKNSQSEAFLMEIIGSFLFYSTILIQGDKDSKLNIDKSLSTLTITCGLACGIAIAGNVSGGGLNPAVAFGLNFSRLLITGHIEECRFLWIYITGPIAAAYLAAYFYNNIYRKLVN